MLRFSGFKIYNAFSSCTESYCNFNKMAFSCSRIKSSKQRPGFKQTSCATCQCLNYVLATSTQSFSLLSVKLRSYCHIQMLFSCRCTSHSESLIQTILQFKKCFVSTSSFMAAGDKNIELNQHLFLLCHCRNMQRVSTYSLKCVSILICWRKTTLV